MVKRLVLLIGLALAGGALLWGLLFLSVASSVGGTEGRDGLLERFWSGFERLVTSGERARHRQAAEETAAFISQEMEGVPAYSSREELLLASLAAVDQTLQGYYCEFGVYQGASINFIADHTSAIVHGFDSFEGLPETWRDGFDKGTFSIDGLPPVRDNVRLYKGWFDASLPVWAAAHPGPIAFAHLDADLYSSTKTVFDLLGDRLVAGTVMQLDEFFNYPGWQEGEYRAFHELQQQRGLSFEYLGYTTGRLGQQVAVRLLGVSPQGFTAAAAE